MRPRTEKGPPAARRDTAGTWPPAARWPAQTRLRRPAPAPPRAGAPTRAARAWRAGPRGPRPPFGGGRRRRSLPADEHARGAGADGHQIARPQHRLLLVLDPVHGGVQDRRPAGAEALRRHLELQVLVVGDEEQKEGVVGDLLPPRPRLADRAA